MAMFDSLKDTLNKGVAAMSVKSETLVEVSRVKSAISAAQRKMDAEKTALGVKLYQSWKEGQASIDLFDDDFVRIQGIEAEIEELNARLVQIKAEEERILGSAQRSAAPAAGTGAAAGGTLFCSNCGKALPAGSRFCDECGTPVK